MNIQFYKDETVVIEDEEIHFFKYPHINKCLQNNLLTNHLELNVSAKNTKYDRYFAKWKHIKTAFNRDVYSRVGRFFLF